MIRDFISKHILIPVGKTYSGRHYFKAKKYQKFLEKIQHKSLDELQSRQNNLLKEMLLYAYENVPFYQELFKKEGILPSDIKDKDHLKAIPFLSKDILNRNLEKLVSKRAVPNMLNLVSTGGTTGTPIRFYRDQRSEWKIDGNNWRFWRYCGYEPGMSIATLWGNENDLLGSVNLYGQLKAVMDNEVMLNFYDLSELRLRNYVDIIKRRKPKIWKGFSSAVYAFMRYLKKNKTDIPLPKAVIITSDKIEDMQRQELDDFFDRAVFNEYGCREFSIMGFECEAHNGIHVGLENIVIEIMSPSDQQGHGEVVVTSLTNWSMPFIRYKLGDASRFMDGACACGRSLPRLQSISGRIADFVVTKSGTLIYGDFFAHLFYGTKGIEHYQIVQKKVGHITIYIEKNEFFAEREIEEFLTKIQQAMQDDMEADIQIVLEIERHRSGKRRSVISEVSGDYL
jgi:phenylacetate-CoA ligase